MIASQHPNFATPLFGGGKRKRDHTITTQRIISPRNEPSNKRHALRELTKLSVISVSETFGVDGDSGGILKSAQLHESGDITTLYDDKITTSISALDHSHPTTVEFAIEDTRFHDIERQFSLAVGAGSSRVLVCCSGVGDMFISTIEVDGRSSLSRQTITLNSEQERVSCVHHAGKVIAIVSFLLLLLLTAI
jgi:uncharacterized membrane protein YdbT with pleckstrin-like domain